MSAPANVTLQSYEVLTVAAGGVTPIYNDGGVGKGIAYTPIRITAMPSNAANSIVYVGGLGSAASPSRGTPLSPGQYIDMPTSNPRAIAISGSAAGLGARVLFGGTFSPPFP